MAKKHMNHCSFCGRAENEVGLLLSGLDGYICDECVQRASEVLTEAMGAKQPAGKSEFNLKKLPKPKEIKAYLDQYVIGQDEAKRYLAVSVYNHYK